MDKFDNSTIEYHEFEDKESPNESLYMSVEEVPNTFRSIQLDESIIHNTHDIWKPNFDNSWNFGQPRPTKKSYYDTSKISDSIDESNDSIQKHIGKINERKSSLRNVNTIPTMLETNASKMKHKQLSLRLQLISKYAFHIVFILLLIVFIIVLIVILVKS